MKRYKDYIFYFLSIPILLIYRYYWSTISQWREDQATNIWLAYTKTLSETSVGLLSSKMIPNPNGMLLFGKILSLFDSLLSSTLFLSMIQITIFYFLTRELTNNFNVNNLAFICISMSTLMSSSSVEFWNNWVLILLNSLFFIFILKFLNTKKSEYLFISLLISIFPPALYLAGILNSIVYTLIIFFSLAINTKPMAVSKKTFFYIFSSLIIVINYLLTWKPYFKAINFKETLGFSTLSLYDRLNILTDSVLQLPGSFLTIWTNQKSFFILQLDRDVISEFSHTLFKIYVEYHKVLFLMFFLFLILGIISISKFKDNNLDNLLVKKLSLFISFVSLSVLINPILGGPNYLLFERMENMSQFYIFYILICFLIPFVFIEYKIFIKKVIPINKVIFIFFIFLNTLLSINLISNSLSYKGDKLTEADVPLIYKVELVDFIGNDSKLRLNKDEVSVAYILGGGIWDWIPNHSVYFSNWYKDYPFTIGRAYDYQLLRKHSIRNSYEGINSRDFNNSDYVVTYKFDEHEILNTNNYLHLYFGQLRLSVKN